MSVEFQISKKPNYVLLSCQGTVSNEALLNVYETALTIAVGEDLKAAVIDIRELEGATPTTTSRYYLGVAVAQLHLDTRPGVFMAVVGKPPILDPSKFGETVATNRGACVKVFTDFDEAITWIEENIIK